MLINESGVRLEQIQELKAKVVTYYEKLPGKTGPQVWYAVWKIKVQENQWSYQIADVNSEEIRATMFLLKSNCKLRGNKSDYVLIKG